MVGFGAAAIADPSAPPDTPGVFVERHRFGPRLFGWPARLPLWRLEQLPRRSFPRTSGEWEIALHGVSLIVDSFIRYERWACVQLGEAHRLRAHAERPRHVRRASVAEPMRLADAWERFLYEAVHR